MSEGDDATLPDTRVHTTDPVPRQSITDLGDRYEVGPVLGRGGMGEVRLARDLRIDREVAVKLMRSTLRDETTLGRFFREARVQGVLEHPAVVPVHDLGIDHDGNPYFVMKRLAGTTLGDVITQADATKWPRRTVLARLIDVCLAIEFAHTRGVIHRDVKPANIMLGDFGEAYVLDWGLARISDDGDSFRGISPLSGEDIGATVAGDLLGTPGYMSPEQARGEPVTAATDVFALGAVLYEVLAGQPALPRGAAAIAETLSTERHRPSAVASDIPPELDDLCARCTAAEPKQRPTARALADKLQAYLDGDRDLAARRDLAQQHAQRAREALSRAGDDGRAAAMREAGSALVLDPTNAAAQELLRGLLLAVPDTVPAEALAAADEERGRTRQASLRKVVWTYLSGVPMLALLLAWLPVRHVWPFVYGFVMFSAAGGLAYFLSKRPMPMRSWWFIGLMALNCASITTLGLLAGPLVMMPFFLVGSLSAFLSQPSSHRTIVMVGFHLLPLVALFAFEWIGVLPRSFHIDTGSVVLTPWAVDISPSTLLLMFGLGLVAQFGSTIDLQIGFQRAQVAAQNQIHAQSWHLRQLLPKDPKR